MSPKAPKIVLVGRRRKAVRRKIGEQYWPNEVLWTGEDDGWFKAPRTLPLVLSLIASKEISGNKDASLVYLELLSRHLGEGVIEMAQEADHAFAAGYVGPRAVRTWRERMKILETNGFIGRQQVGNQDYRYVALIHPTIVIERLRRKGMVTEKWRIYYENRKMETKEPTFEEMQTAVNAAAE